LELPQKPRLIVSLNPFQHLAPNNHSQPFCPVVRLRLMEQLCQVVGYDEQDASALPQLQPAH
jgi:hypothetical protein